MEDSSKKQALAAFAFIKAQFQAKQSENLRQLLKKEPAFRNDKDIRDIGKIIQQRDYFAKITSQKIFNQICSKIRYRHYQEGDYIYRINDTGECFFVIIDGQVDLIVPEFIENLRQNQQDSDASEHDQFDIRLTNLSNLSIPEEQETEEKAIYQDRVVHTAKKWEAFGDITLNETNKRVTNALAKSETHLIEIRRQQYQLINKAQVMTKSREKFLFINNLPLFKRVFKYSLEGFVYYLNQVSCLYNRKVYTEQDPIQNVYLVVEGEFKLQKIINKRKAISNIRNRKMPRRRKTEQNDIQKDYLRPGQHQLKRKISPEKKVSYRIISRGEILGDAESVLGSNFPLYQESCVCLSQIGILYSIPRKIFLDKLLSPENQVQEIKKYLQKKLEAKQKAFNTVYLKHTEDTMFQQFLPIHERVNLQAVSRKSQIQISKEKKHRSLSLTYSQNMFSDMNITFTQSSASKPMRKSHKFSIRSTGSPRLSESQASREKKIPSSVKDIVKIVAFKSKYSNFKKEKDKQIGFELNTDNVPRHIKQKFKHLLQSLGKGGN